MWAEEAERFSRSIGCDNRQVPTRPIPESLACDRCQSGVTKIGSSQIAFQALDWWRQEKLSPPFISLIPVYDAYDLVDTPLLENPMKQMLTKKPSCTSQNNHPRGLPGRWSSCVYHWHFQFKHCLPGPVNRVKLISIWRVRRARGRSHATKSPRSKQVQEGNGNLLSFDYSLLQLHQQHGGATIAEEVRPAADVDIPKPFLRENPLPRPEQSALGV
ncbi:hypothetical protein IFM47457_11021 [Aspergillus lentulus]|nr:hypothetical protein IFM47457_11021 [Aspergillus lentulus]